MPPTLIPLVKWTLATLGGAAIAHWAASEIRRINEELERVRNAPVLDADTRKRLPTLRRDPQSGEWRLV